jgi:hypothetical protein
MDDDLEIESLHMSVYKLVYLSLVTSSKDLHWKDPKSARS